MEEDNEGMGYLSTLPQRVVTIYIPMVLFLIILLFPFYWMGVTSFKSDNELLDMKNFNPWTIDSPTLENFRKLLFETDYSGWMINTVSIAVFATIISMVASIMAAYAIARIRFYGANTVGALIFLAYLVPPSILFIPLALVIFDYGLYDTPYALILSYPTILIPFSTWLLMGYFKTIPYELEECAIIDGANRLQILTKIILPLAIPGLISAGIFAFTLCWNEFIYALTFISSSENKTVPVALLSELVTGDIYHWGALMAGALFGSIPVALVYSFFVEHYVSSMTGAVKE
ncbi:MAG: carbohydrate ABC transporter permease [SAR324 cluster bacterium]|jgi:multiple sugar transport system permease protein|nr:carbohydrate ABC transporter permease [SAR324 cluster bacterium]|tara:strand:+ start:174 stop:1040 length:867 start_codon:yes stop_codon:yes gene_type:complete